MSHPYSKPWAVTFGVSFGIFSVGLGLLSSPSSAFFVAGCLTCLCAALVQGWEYKTELKTPLSFLSSLTRESTFVSFALFLEVGIPSYMVVSKATTFLPIKREVSQPISTQLTETKSNQQSQQTAFARFKQDCVNGTSLPENKAFMITAGGRQYPLAFTYAVPLNFASRTKSLCVYSSAQVLFDDVWTDISNNYRNYLKPNYPGVSYEIVEGFMFSGEVRFYIEDRLENTKSVGFRGMSMRLGWSVKFYGPNGEEY